LIFFKKSGVSNHLNSPCKVGTVEVILIFDKPAFFRIILLFDFMSLLVLFLLLLVSFNNQKNKDNDRRINFWRKSTEQRSISKGIFFIL